ncbi:hypothetical protein LSH36_1062g00017 [Paralvinella palmiformis]|uniref:Uncharacterized protein n=1 Tax=Paralvinella palmiformis TaxID=53620 RepID=A0AAD9IWI7_9ANNE|nr:hypothetical protein LSH36_1062g00017 [Paralvinella palmiformis]
MTIGIRRHDNVAHRVRFADSVLLPKIRVFKRRPTNIKQRKTELRFFLPAINKNTGPLPDWIAEPLNTEEHGESDSRRAIDREGTFIRGEGSLWMPRGANSMWLPRERRYIDIGTERKIVHHLRRLVTPIDPFSSYTDFGDKIKQKIPTDNRDTVQSQSSPSNEPVNDLNPNPPLPGIKPRFRKQEKASRSEFDDVKEEVESVVSEKNSDASDSEGQDDLLEPFVEPEIVVDHKYVAVSPVTTPMLYLPESRSEAQPTLKETRLRLLEGDLRVQLNTTPRLIRIYIQSSSTDSEVERSRLIETVYSKLRSYGQEKGYDLHIIDLHWGHREIMADDHNQAEMAERTGNTSEASQNGRKQSVFGRGESQTNIPSRETSRFDSRRESSQGRDQNALLKLQKEASILKNCRIQANNIDPTLLPIWYKLDENAVPAVFKLQKISSVYKDILSADVKRRNEAKRQWTIVRKKLTHLFSTVSKQIFDEPAVIKKYNITLTEIELERGLSRGCEATFCHKYWFQREIEDIHAGVSDDKLEDYQDLLPFTSTVDATKQSILDDWKTCTLPDTSLDVLRSEKLANYHQTIYQIIYTISAGCLWKSRQWKNPANGQSRKRMPQMG